jgi:hypothetical protein
LRGDSAQTGLSFRLAEIAFIRAFSFIELDVELCSRHALTNPEFNSGFVKALLNNELCGHIGGVSIITPISVAEVHRKPKPDQALTSTAKQCAHAGQATNFRRAIR